MYFLKQHRSTLIPIAALLLLSALATGILLFLRQPGGKAVVIMGGNTVMTLPLDRDTQVVLGSGKRTNSLTIRDGYAVITQASCPDQICIQRGPIQYQAETIVCLPNRLVVRIEGGKPPPQDALPQ